MQTWLTQAGGDQTVFSTECDYQEKKKNLCLHSKSCTPGFLVLPVSGTQTANHAQLQPDAKNIQHGSASFSIVAHNPT